MDHREPRSRIESLDSLRGLCALSVAIFHFNTTGALSNAAFFRNSWLLVDFFFVLSGFVITAAYADDLHKGFAICRFVLLRLARVWPLHVIMILCFVLLESSKLLVQLGPAVPLFAPPREVGSLFVNLLLLQVFGIYDHVTWNVPSWSIAAEFWVYVIAAFIFRYVGAGRSALFVMIAGLCAVVMVVSGAPFLNLAHDGAVIRCLYGFSIGALTWSVFARRVRGRPRHAITLKADVVRATMAEVGCVLAAVSAVSLCSGGAIAVAMPLLFGACVLVLAHQGGLVTALLSHRALTWLGSISYSIYMTHLFVEGRLLDALIVIGRLTGVTIVERVVVDNVAKRVLTGSEFLVDVTILVLLLAIVGISYGSYRYVEQPANRWAKSRMRRAPSVLAPAS